MPAFSSYREVFVRKTHGEVPGPAGQSQGTLPDNPAGRYGPPDDGDELVRLRGKRADPAVHAGNGSWSPAVPPALKVKTPACFPAKFALRAGGIGGLPLAWLEALHLSGSLSSWG